MLRFTAAARVFYSTGGNNMDVSNLNLSNRQIEEEHHLANARAFLEPGKACLMPYAVRVGKKIPGWKKTLAAHMITPRLGAEFLECELCIAPGGGAEGAVVNSYENFMFVVAGSIEVKILGRRYALEQEGFFWTPPGADFEVGNKSGDDARVLWVRKKYIELNGYRVPRPVVGNVKNLDGVQSPADYEQHCLPFDNDFGFDMAMNICTYYPGVTMPRTETHICEHCNYVISGRGFIWINGIYHEVFPGDAWYVAPYTPHTATGLAPAALRYLLYKNINREFML